MNATIARRSTDDDQFGPSFSGPSRSFDFTLLFEDSILVIAPTSLFLIAACVRAFLLHGTPPTVVLSSSRLYKVAFVSAFTVLQLTLLLLWATNPALGSKATLPAASLDFVAACILCVLSAYEHTRTVAPSSVICLYLLISLPFDITRLRTLFLLDTSTTQSIATILTLSTAVKVCVTVSEAASKRQILLARYQTLPPESTSGIYSKSVFWWLNPLLRVGFLRILQVGDLFALDDSLTSAVIGRNFQRAWNSTKKSRKYALLVSISAVMKWKLLASGLPRILLIGLKYAQPFLLRRVISYVSNRENQPANVGWGLVGAYALVYAGSAILTAAYNHMLNRCIVRIRGGLVSLIYTKTLDLSITALDESAALTLMSADVQNITDALRYLHNAWASIMEVGIAMYLLYLNLAGASVAPAIFFLVIAIATGTMSRFMPRLQKRWVEGIQTRVSFTSTMLGAMRSIKLLGMSGVVKNLTQDLRRREVNLATGMRKASIFRIVFQNSAIFVAPVVTFAVFIIQANAAGRPLDTGTAFSILSILQLADPPINALVSCLPELISSISCYSRIQDFLLSPSRQDHRISLGRMRQGSFRDTSTYSDEFDVSVTGNLSRDRGDHRGQTSIMEMRQAPSLSHMLSDDAMVLKSCSFGWNQPILHDIDIRIKTSSIVMVIGPVGCGKSTLIKGMLGETPSSAGFVYTGTTSIAFADQDPWNRNSTIRESIRSESGYEEPFYQEVIECCGLEQDLKDLPGGDSTIIGSKGISLSGGQKQRLALARAVYSRHEILMLDDVFSGLDADTEEQIFRRLFSKAGLLRKNRTTVILVSHAVHRLPYADHIIALDARGRVSEQGTYETLRKGGGYVQGLAVRFKDSQSENEEQPTEFVAKPQHRVSVATGEDDQVANLSRKTGDWKSYRYYFSACGWWPSMLSIFWCFVFNSANRAPGLLVTYFTGGQDADRSSNTLFMSLFGATAFVSAFGLILLCVELFLRMVPRSSNGLHLSLLDTVMCAPLSFFTKTDSGTTLNRFSQDMSLVDTELPISFIETGLTFSNAVVISGMISASASYFLAAMPVTLLALYIIQKYYLRTSRQIRLLDLEAKAPLYSHFQETLSGLPSIRAFGWVDKFNEQNMEFLDYSQKPFYLLFCIQRWLSVVLDLLVAGLATALMVIVVTLRHKIDPGLVGLGLLNIMSFNTTLASLVDNWTQLETSIGAIARLRDFTIYTQDENKAEENTEPPAPWPQRGGVQLHNFAASYSDDSEPVLKQIDLVIRPGEKFGICGRSGSGKSSLLASLFHLLEYRAGTISVDGLDLAALPRDLVRQRLNVIPQEPYWISTSSVRSNMDPWSDLPATMQDAEFIDALTRCQIWHIVRAQGGLDAKMDAEFLSHGQRQLFCLARAILRKSKVVVLDEVSASVDIHTDALMQSVIRAEFAECTIISVAHRLNTIVDFDRIAVLSAGRVVECDTPQTLLSREGSKFRELYEM